MLYRDPENTMEKLEKVKEALNIHCKTSSLKDNPFELNLVLEKYNDMFVEIGEDIYCFQKLKEMLSEYIDLVGSWTKGKDLPPDFTPEQAAAVKDILDILDSSIHNAKQKYYTEQVR